MLRLVKPVFQAAIARGRSARARLRRRPFGLALHVEDVALDAAARRAADLAAEEQPLQPGQRLAVRPVDAEQIERPTAPAGPARRTSPRARRGSSATHRACATRRRSRPGRRRHRHHHDVVGADDWLHPERHHRPVEELLGAGRQRRRRIASEVVADRRRERVAARSIAAAAGRSLPAARRPARDRDRRPARRCRALIVGDVFGQRPAARLASAAPRPPAPRASTLRRRAIWPADRLMSQSSSAHPARSIDVGGRHDVAVRDQPPPPAR